MTTYEDQRDKLAKSHGGLWGEHMDYPVEDWQAEVACGDTRLGYWDWVMAQMGIGAES